MGERLSTEPSVGPANTTEKGIRDLLSLPYFRRSVENLVLNRNRVGYSATDDRSYDGTLKLSDGSLVWSLTFRTESPDYAEERALSWAKYADGPIGFAHSIELDEGRMRLLEAFVDYLQSGNVEVVFSLPPYHPAAYDILVHSERYSIVLEVEAFYRDLARSRGIAVVGSYDPEKSSCTKEDFFDGDHSKKSGVDRVFSSLDCTPPAKCHLVESQNLGAVP
jgi:hypothetical protein